MKYLIFLLGFLILLYSQAICDYWDTGDTTIINSLPYNIPAGNHLYALVSHKITSATYGINANGKSNWTLVNRTSGVKDTIIAKQYGLHAGNGVFIKLHNIVGMNFDRSILGDSASVLDSSCGTGGNRGWIRCDQGGNIWLDSCNITTTKTINRPVYFYGKGGFRIWGGNYSFNWNIADRRDQLDGGCIVIDLVGNDTVNYPISVSIRSVNFLSAPHVPLSIIGTHWGKWEVKKCDILVDGWNIYRSYYYGISSILTNGDCFGFNIGVAGHGSICDSNYIHSGTQHEGGQGIIIQRCKGIASDPVCFRQNIVDVSQGPTSQSPVGRGRVIYFRFIPSGGSADIGNEYVIAEYNHFIGRFDTDTSTTYRGREMYGLIGYWSGDEGDYQVRIWHNEWKNNHFKLSLLEL